MGIQGHRERLEIKKRLTTGMLLAVHLLVGTVMTCN